MSKFADMLRLTATSATLPMLVCSHTANAQAANAQAATPGAQGAASAAAPGNEGDIVVTAQRRSESIQTTPVAVTALSSETIANYGVKDFADYAKQVPGLSFGSGGSASVASQGYGVSSTREVTIRGVAGSNTTSLYVDDTPLPAAVDVRVLDLDRIEVLRGPQGTLFGAASMGGTVRLVTKQASLNDTSGSVTMQGSSTDHGGAGYDASATWNVPLVRDSVALRVSAFSSLQPGYFTKYYGVSTVAGVDFQPGQQVIGQKNHVGEQRAFGGIATITAEPAGLENLHLNATVIYQKSATDGAPVSTGDPESYAQYEPLNLDDYSNSTFEFYALTGRYKTDIGSIISSTSYFHRDANDQQDGTAFNSYLAPLVGGTSPYLPTLTTLATGQKIFTEELRFESSFNSPLQLTTGVFYQNTHNSYNYDYEGSIIYGTSAPSPIYFRTIAPIVQSQLAAFVNFTLDLTDKLHLSAGARVARQTFEQDNNNVSSLADTTDNVIRQKDTPITPRFVAEYKFDRSNMIYGSASKGFRSGGGNSPFPAACDAQSFGFASNNNNPYSSDSLWSYELGSKNAFFNHKLTTRAAIYQIDWSNIQQSVGVTTCGLQGTLNVGKAKIDGAELEAIVAPVTGLLISGSFGYTDARITQAGASTSGAVVGAAVGQKLNGVPEWTANARAEYGWSIGSATAFIRGQYSYTGSSVSYVNGITPRAAYQLVDLRTGFHRDMWTVSVFGNNVFNVKPNLGDISQLSGQIPGVPNYLIGTPRTIGVEVRRAF